MKFKLFKLELPRLKRPANAEELKKWRQFEKGIVKILLLILGIIMIYPLLFWGGSKRWIGVLIDIGMLYALYKLIFRDVPIVNIGMLVSPLWGRLPEYLAEGKHVVLPWDKIEFEELKVKTYPVREEKGYLTLDGAPINLNVDIFYRIDRHNIYLYKEVEGTETAAIDGKVKEYIYGKIGALETDEVIAHQGDIATGVLEEIRLHPISSKTKLLAFQEKKKELLKKDIEIANSRLEAEKDKERIEILTSKINKIETDIKTTSAEIKVLYEKETRKLKEDLDLKLKEALQHNKQEEAGEIRTEIEKIEKLEEKELLKIISAKIEKVEEEMLSELEQNFAIKVLGSRIYGLDIADKEAKEGRSKRTTTMFERTAIMTEWGTTNMVMEMLKKKYPGLTDSELLEAVLVNRGRIKKDKKVYEIEGLDKILPEVAKAIFGNK